MQWDIFCRVIDNHGDAGVCWRLAADLAARGEAVRLWIDDASALAWMAPQGAAGVTVARWPDMPVPVEPAQVVIEAFGCELPTWFVQRMAAAEPAPAWVNLEYLSAEDYVERSHGLQSPQANGLRKRFYYPGFTPSTGGLIRETDLSARQQRFDARTWLADRGLSTTPGERAVSLFCYRQPGLPALLDVLSRRPTQLLVTPGHAADQVSALLGAGLRRGALRATFLPALTQREYDELLWACDLNIVRGEDSFVRAQWAGQPFLWQIYPQHDAAHLIKLDAFLNRFTGGAAPELTAFLRQVFTAWNKDATAFPALQDLAAWQQHCMVWRDRLLAQTDLSSQLLRFVAESR